MLTATQNQSRRCGGVYRTVCIASDGESKRGEALVHLTMNTTSSVDSPIYEQLRPLDFLLAQMISQLIRTSNMFLNGNEI